MVGKTSKKPIYSLLYMNGILIWSWFLSQGFLVMRVFSYKTFSFPSGVKTCFQWSKQLAGFNFEQNSTVTKSMHKKWRLIFGIHFSIFFVRAMIFMYINPQGPPLCPPPETVLFRDPFKGLSFRTHIFQIYRPWAFPIFVSDLFNMVNNGSEVPLLLARKSYWFTNGCPHSHILNSQADQSFTRNAFLCSHRRRLRGFPLKASLL